MDYQALRRYYDAVSDLYSDLERKMAGDWVQIQEARAILAVYDLLNYLSAQLAAFPDGEPE